MQRKTREVSTGLKVQENSIRGHRCFFPLNRSANTIHLTVLKNAFSKQEGRKDQFARKNHLYITNHIHYSLCSARPEVELDDPEGSLPTLQII